MKKHAKTWWAVPLVITGLVMSILAQGEAEEESVYDQEAEAKFYFAVSNYFLSSIYDLEGVFVENQHIHLKTPPPDGRVFYQYSSPFAVPADWSGFPEGFVAGLVSETVAGVTVYDILIRENPESQTIEFFNSQGELIHTMGLPENYEPFDYLFEKYPSFAALKERKQEQLQSRYHPARVAVQMRLVGDEAFAQYLYNQAQIAETQSSRQRSSTTRSSGYFMRSSGTTGLLEVTQMRPYTNEMELTITYPLDDQNEVVEVFGFDPSSPEEAVEFMTNIWALLDTNVVLTGATQSTWSDDSITAYTSNRFYTLGKTWVDQDSDTISDAREVLYYKTDPTNPDSDGDLLSDPEELFTYDTDPNESDSDYDGMADYWELVHGFEPAMVDDGILAWWKLSEPSGTNVYDFSGNEHHGFIQYGAEGVHRVAGPITNVTYFRPGVGGAMTFGTDSSLDPTGEEMAVTFWYRPVEHEAPYIQNVLGKPLVTDGFRVRMYYSNSPAFNLKINGTNVTVFSGDYSVRFEGGEWGHFAGVYDGSSMKVYLNGVEMLSSNAAGPISSLLPFNFQIGYSVAAQNIRGTMADVRLYQNALTSNEVYQMWVARADLDGDGYLNYEESIAGTDPNSRSNSPAVARGVVINELLYNPVGVDTNYEWFELYSSSPHPVNLGGLKIDGTLSSGSGGIVDMFTFPADTSILPGRHYAIGGTGAETKQTNWVDYTQTFTLVNYSHYSGGKMGALRLTAGTNVADAVFYNFPNGSNLLTNGYGYIGYPDDVPPYTRSGESLYRVQRGKDTDNVDDWGVVSVVSTSDASTNVILENSSKIVDSDGDGVTDEDEIRGRNNPWGDATDYLLPDCDYDSLNDGREQEVGTDPWVADTDGDGIADGIEVWEMGSDPIDLDVGGISQTVWSVSGTNEASYEGVWAENGSSIYSLSAGGTISYTLSIPTQGVYALELEGTQYDPNASLSDFLLQLSVDDQIVGQKLLRTSFGSVDTAQWMLPWLSSGSHTVKIRWRYAEGNGSLRITALNAYEYGGDDSDANGQYDWLDNRTNVSYTVDDIAAAALVSPYFIEGEVIHYDLLDITSDYTPTSGIHSAASARRGLAGHWYADVPLSADNPVSVTFSSEGGWLERTSTVAWADLNLFSPTTLTYSVRLDDGFLFNALPDGEGPGEIEIFVNATSQYTSVTNQPWACYFTNTGTYEVNATWNDGGGDQYSLTVAVEVLAGEFNGDPAVWSGKIRDWDCPGLPTNIWVDMDAEVLWERVGVSTGSHFTLSSEQPNAYSAIARINDDDGAIISSARIRGFQQVFSSEYGEEHIFYQDGASRIFSGVIVDAEEIPDDLDIIVNVVAGGVVIADNFVEDFITSNVTLSAGTDLNEYGAAPLVFYVAEDAWDSICHELIFEQNDRELGEW